MDPNQDTDKRHAAAAREREHEDPHEGSNPISRAVLILAAGLAAWGAWYIATAPIDQPARLGDRRTVADLTAKAGGADGASIFTARCVACHQATGMGLPGAFPPLAGSEWVNGDAHKVASIVLRGITGPLTVKGAQFNGAMPPFADQLSDAEIAAVLTHVRSQWGNSTPPITPDIVAETRTKTASMTGPFAGEAALGKPGG
ncbi:cytochrome c [uncultured Ralstonia sp.]|jgi:mono/diheme cytochrome c family protein|uniref:c-type cytochrome n=1 Tax=Ralstonia sp. TaxID=54061 RepID=UPI001EA499B6|nr:cytochrome c [uncultured Ralstonia sp.]UCF25392.1 MAG: cytochrome c [Ralstonia sp.]